MRLRRGVALLPKDLGLWCTSPWRSWRPVSSYPPVCFKQAACFAAACPQVARAIPEYFFPSEVIIHHRDAAEHMYLISSGMVQEAPAGNPSPGDEALTLGPGSVSGMHGL